MGIFKLALWISQNKLNSDFQLICIIPWNTMKLERMKSSSEAKLRYYFPKNIKFHFCLVFWAIFWFYQQFHCKIYVWRWCQSNLGFFMVISITLIFQIKKFKFPKFCSCGFLWSQSVNKVLRFCSWYGLWHVINFEINVSET